MAARGVSVPGLDVRVAEVEKLVESSVLHGSGSLCRLLQYLANRAIHDPGIAIREHEIAAEVFGRSAVFDPRLDSTVRVNVARLRAKLIDYYSGPGAGDAVVIELPKGSYTVVFHSRAVESNGELKVVDVPARVAGAGAVAAAQPAGAVVAPAARANQLLLVALVCVTGIAATLAATLLLERRSAPDRRPTAPAADTRSLQRFWGTLLNGPNDPWVVFSNATFVGRPSTGMRYLVPSRDSGRDVVDFYTGIGEVLGIHTLDRTFASLNRSIRVKRGGLLSLDDVENNDVVFVGSSLENLALRDVPGMQDFQFKVMDHGPRAGDGALVNLAPRPGEPDIFLPSSLPLTEDYAVVALVPGLNPTRWGLILAGTSTIGTQGAVEYVCRENSVKELLERIGSPKQTPRLGFEAVLKIHIKGGVPVRGEIVLFHDRRPSS